MAEALRVAAGDGRLSAEELDERLERALTAKTYAELAALTTDLPRSGHITARPPRRTLWQWLRRAPRPYAVAA